MSLNERYREVLVDGVVRPALDGSTYPTINPATEEVLGVAADCGPADIDEAIGAARRAFDESGWSSDLSLRVRCLRQLHDAFVNHADEIRALLASDHHDARALKLANAELDDATQSLAVLLVEKAMEEALARKGLA